MVNEVLRVYVSDIIREAVAADTSPTTAQCSDMFTNLVGLTQPERDSNFPYYYFSTHHVQPNNVRGCIDDINGMHHLHFRCWTWIICRFASRLFMSCTRYYGDSAPEIREINSDSRSYIRLLNTPHLSMLILCDHNYNHRLTATKQSTKTMSKTSGITSVANDSASGQVLRSAAAAAEASIKKSSRFSPCSVNELTSWVAADSGYAYNDQDKRHKAMVRESYWCDIIREAVTAETSPPTAAQSSVTFSNLGEDVKDKWCTRIASMHAAVAYALWTILVPYYVAERSKMGNRSHHWRPLEPDATLRKERMQAYNAVKAAMASDYVKRHPQGSSSSTTMTGTSLQMTSGSDISWTVIFQLRGTLPMQVAPLPSLLEVLEWMVLVKGHGVPEDLLSGTRIVPPLNYADLAMDADAFKPCKKYTFLASITEDAFFSDIVIPKAFIVMRALRVAVEQAIEGMNRNDMCRQIFEATSENTTAGFNSNLASVFGAIKRSGAERYRPDAMDIAAIQADFDSLASYVHVSRATMLESYITPSHYGPAQRIGQLMRDEGLNSHVPPPTAPARGRGQLLGTSSNTNNIIVQDIVKIFVDSKEILNDYYHRLVVQVQAVDYGTIPWLLIAGKTCQVSLRAAIHFGLLSRVQRFTTWGHRARHRRKPYRL
ncbi:hypothetical protein JKP88DRAFT_248340 [Tribonema minus]|uniref:Uncharacterized protein n=1 Tax=Tribonema minus TaxID=303371 RepID=A0A835YWR7_9STRA|nr:hypothetical protein JKP88DRAFT_248340 [Tribonema minus]